MFDRSHLPEAAMGDGAVRSYSSGMAARATPRWWRIRPWLGAVIALAVLGGMAAAQPAGPRDDEEEEVERPVVGVINLREGTDAKALTDAIAQQIQATPELVGIGDYRVAAALVDPLVDEEKQAVDAARDKLAAAHEKMGELDLDAATRLAGEGQLEVVGKVTPARATTELLADLAFAEGQARFARRDQDRSQVAFAKAAFTWVHRLSPGRKLDPDAYLDDLIGAFDAAAKATGTATLEIADDRTIWIDGQEQPAGTRTATVPAGRHWIVATGPDQQPSGQKIDVVDGQRFTVALSRRTATGGVLIARARRALAAAPDPTARAGAMATIQRIAGLSAAVIVTSDDKDQLAVQLWRNKAPGFGEIKPAKQPWSSEAERTLAPLVPKKKVIDDPKGPFDGGGIGPVGPVDGEKPWYRKRWVQVSIVAGVIGVIAGSIAISNAAGASHRPPGDISETPPGMGRQ
jgi:hypothetical protein